MPEYDKRLIELAKEAIIACADQKHVSVSLIQRRCGISFNLAKRVLQILADRGLAEADEQNQYVCVWTEKAKHGGATNHER